MNWSQDLKRKNFLAKDKDCFLIIKKLIAINTKTGHKIMEGKKIKTIFGDINMGHINMMFMSMLN